MLRSSNTLKWLVVWIGAAVYCFVCKPFSKTDAHYDFTFGATSTRFLSEVGGSESDATDDTSGHNDTTGHDDTTSHDDGHGESSHGLFGILSTIDPDDGTVSVILIIAAVLATEHVFHGLHRITHDTPFQDMVSAIEKELMIVGCMAFIFKLVVISTYIDPHWLEALEYADLFVPIVSFVFCAQGLFLILISIQQCSLWSKAFHLTLDEILFEYYNMDESKLEIIDDEDEIQNMG
jgi:hypothetical protein